VVAHSLDCRPVGLSKDRFDLLRLEIAGCNGRLPLERDGQDLGALRDVFGILVSHEAEEAADRGEPAVACTDRAPAPMLGMVEERANLSGRDVGQHDSRDPAALSPRDEPKQ